MYRGRVVWGRVVRGRIDVVSLILVGCKSPNTVPTFILVEVDTFNHLALSCEDDLCQSTNYQRVYESKDNWPALSFCPQPSPLLTTPIKNARCLPDPNHFRRGPPLSPWQASLPITRVQAELMHEQLLIKLMQQQYFEWYERLHRVYIMEAS